MKYLILIMSIGFLLLSCGDDDSATGETHDKDEKKQFYGFYKSELGENYKRFEHNVFGFQIDIPNNWFFGVIGDLPTGEIIIYPEGLKTEKFSKDYLSIRVSNPTSLPVMMDISQEEICLATLEGKRKMQTIEVLNNCEPISMNSEGTYCKTRLESKTGFLIIEEIFIFKKNDEIRSVTLCYEEEIDEKKLNLLRKISKTFQMI